MGERAYTDEQKKNRRRAKAALDETRKLGGSKLDEVRAVKDAVTKNDKFKEVITRGREPEEDSRWDGGKIAHFGTRGAPNVYYEKKGGRRYGKGSRTP